MAYIQPTDPRQRLSILGGAGPGSNSGAPVSGASRPPPSSDGGQRFGALRSFFEANQPIANTQAGALTAAVDKEAQGAVDLSNRAGETYESDGGANLAADAIGARDSALGKVNALGSQQGLAGLLGDGASATYTEGQRNADATLFGRSPGVGETANRWAGVLGALDPTYKPGADPGIPQQNARAKPLPDPRTPNATYYDENGQLVPYYLDPYSAGA